MMTTLLASTLIALMPSNLPPEKPNLLKNGAFKSDLANWKTVGHVRVEPSSDKPEVALGPGPAELRQSYRCPGEHVLYAAATLSPKDARAELAIECFDAKNQLVLSETAAPGTNQVAGIYLKTHSFTNRVEFIVRQSGPGVTRVSNVVLNNDNYGIRPHRPQIDLDEAVRPFWLTETISRESVLLLSSNGGPATGPLLFAPEKILSVTDASLGQSFTLGRDYDVTGNLITARPTSKILVMKDSEFATGEFPWTRTDGRHIFVTYRHDATWTGPKPAYQGNRLPRFAAKLRTRKPVIIAAYGDSITLGINVSGFQQLPPYLPPWPKLVARALEKRSPVTLYNAALGGQTAYWGQEKATALIGPLRPDLVIVAFGMNDFWSYTPTQFRENIAKLMTNVRSKSPNAEFLLVSPMKFDPAYTADPTYVNNLAGYAAALNELTGPGVAFFDMTQFSDALYRAKTPKSLLADPLHPADFLARCYAMGVIATIIEP
jgi:lysophospholipase L1-like esterase